MSIQLIQQYHTKVEQIIRYSGVRNESSLRKPFQDLLEQYARSKKLMLVAEVGVPALAGRPGKAVPPEVLESKALEQLRATLGRQADRMLPALIEQFYRDADRLLGQARQASEQGRVEDLRIASHSLKSTSATFGAMRLSAVARELESLARSGRLDGVVEQIARAEAEFARAKTALEAKRHEP